MTAHGIMFHHFHVPGQPMAQGSLTADLLDRMINFIGKKNILPASEWYEKALKGTLKNHELCLTFDDNLMCQYDIARPVLESHGLTAFFFIYSSVCEGAIENLEVYRVFRTDHFNRLEDFYQAFERTAESTLPELSLAARMKDFRHEDYLKPFAFYTPQDKRFRYLRDQVLGVAAYCRVMDAMIAERHLSKKELAKGLWMDNDCLRNLARTGHMLGLHSYSHPTRLCDLALADQSQEYRRNFDHLKQVTGQAPVSMSHPCNSYTPATLQALRDLGIRLGFCSNMGEVKKRSPLEFPRRDHADVAKEMAA